MYTLPESPLTLPTPQEGATGELINVLRQLQERPPEPLIPPGNPLLTLATMLSGLSAGVRGQKNPVMEQLLEQRRLENESRNTGLTRNISIANLLLSQKRESRQETQQEEERKLRRLEFGYRVTSDQLKNAIEANDTEAVRAVYARQKALGLLEPEFDVSKALADKIQYGSLEDQRKLIAAQYIEGRPPLKPIPAFADLAQTEAGKAQLRKMFTLENSALVAAEAEGKLADARFKVMQNMAAERMSKGEGQPGDVILLSSGDRERATLYAQTLQASGTKLDPLSQTLVDNYNTILKMKVKAGKQDEEIKELEKQIKTEELALKQDPMRSPKDLLAYSVRIAALQEAALSLPDKTPTEILQKQELQKKLSALFVRVLQLYDQKTTPTAPAGPVSVPGAKAAFPPSGAKPASPGSKSLRRELGIEGE